MASQNNRGAKRKISDSESSDEDVLTNGLHNEDDDSFDDVKRESEMEQEADSSDDDQSDVEVSTSSQEAGSESDNDDNDDDDDDDDDVNSDSSVEKGSGKETSLRPAVDEFDKAKAVTSQLRFWEHLLKMRVNLQKAMVIINQLPQCEILHELVSEAGEPCQKSIASGRGCLKRLLDQLFEIETLLLSGNPETKHIATGESQQTSDDKTAPVDDDDEEITSESEKGSEDEDNVEEASSQQKHQTVKRSDYPHLISKRHKAFEKYRNSTIQKWADKTQSLSKFAAFDQSVAKQIQQTLTDRSRLVARTRVNRLGNRVLGKVSLTANLDAPAIDADNTAPTAAAVDQDEEIFDDNDFYHHILREFIQYKNSYDPIVLTKQWLEIQQYRKKAKKNVDRKASKGRKTRYNVHKQLINFMAPLYAPDAWTNDQRDDLFKNLFGKSLSGAA